MLIWCSEGSGDFGLGFFGKLFLYIIFLFLSFLDLGKDFRKVEVGLFILIFSENFSG
jgi:hypothetical protein